MTDPLSAIVGYLIDPNRHAGALDPERWLDGRPSPDRPPPDGQGAAIVASAFLVLLSGPDHPAVERARAVLDGPPVDAPAGLVALFREATAAIRREVADRSADDPDFAARLDRAAATLTHSATADRAATEAAWSVLYPEAVGLAPDIAGSVAALRRRRIVEVEAPNARPIGDAAREVLFTSNVLLGLPLEPAGDDGPADVPVLDPAVAAAVERARQAPQRYWYDHPIPIGVAPRANELLHGLAGLDEALGAEPPAAGGPRRLTCLLSVSVTHTELHAVARRYIEVELDRVAALERVDVLVVTETDVRRLVDEVIAPALERYGPASGRAGQPDGPLDLAVLGVDGEYGRHYSFLKAIAAVWAVLVDPGIRGTFKIDLDQVFPQPELIAQTGRTALQHLETPLWGARARDGDGRPVDLGMLAGALVNAGDLGDGLFSPDVPIPADPRRPSEQVFFSPLPQAVSTRAEMVERYDGPRPDGVGTALERVHVTGGTNGILVDALRRHRPFTPSFIGRAEDQAYGLSVQGRQGPRLAYVHAAGLVMRHDKDAYARAAIEAAQAGKLVGDDVRILVFSAYARALASGAAGGRPTVGSIKALADPFTGGFISRLPITCVLLRFALRIVEAYQAGKPELGRSYATIGARRLLETLAATADGEAFAARIEAERVAWGAIYDTLDGLEEALAAGDEAAFALRRRARELIDGWRVRPPGSPPVRPDS